MNSGAPLVLIAEDDRATREALTRALELEGYRVHATRDGEEALSAIEAAAPDVILLDLMMPNIDGLTVCRRLRGRDDRTPILMLTARTETSDRVSASSLNSIASLLGPAPASGGEHRSAPPLRQAQEEHSTSVPATRHCAPDFVQRSRR